MLGNAITEDNSSEAEQLSIRTRVTSSNMQCSFDESDGGYDSQYISLVDILDKFLSQRS